MGTLGSLGCRCGYLARSVGLVVQQVVQGQGLCSVFGVRVLLTDGHGKMNKGRYQAFLVEDAGSNCVNGFSAKPARPNGWLEKEIPVLSFSLSTT